MIGVYHRSYQRDDTEVDRASGFSRRRLEYTQRQSGEQSAQSGSPPPPPGNCQEEAAASCAKARRVMLYPCRRRLRKGKIPIERDKHFAYVGESANASADEVVVIQVKTSAILLRRSATVAVWCSRQFGLICRFSDKVPGLQYGYYAPNTILATTATGNLITVDVAVWAMVERRGFHVCRQPHVLDDAFADRIVRRFRCEYYFAFDRHLHRRHYRN